MAAAPDAARGPLMAMESASRDSARLGDIPGSAAEDPPPRPGCVWHPPTHPPSQRIDDGQRVRERLAGAGGGGDAEVVRGAEASRQLLPHRRLHGKQLLEAELCSVRERGASE